MSERQHPEQVIDSQVLGMRRRINAELANQERPTFIQAIFDFSKIAITSELGTDDSPTNLQNTVEKLKRTGLSPEEISRASVVAVNMWARQKEANLIQVDSDRAFNSLPKEEIEEFERKAGTEKLERERKRRLAAFTQEAHPTQNILQPKLITNVAKKTGLTKKDTARAITAFLAEIEAQLNEGRRVILSGFGTFHVIEMKEKKVVTPGSNTEVQVPAHRLPRFIPGKILKRRVKER